MRAKFPGLLRAARLSRGQRQRSPVLPTCANRSHVGVRVCPGGQHGATLPLSLFAVTLLSPWVKCGGCHSPKSDSLWHRLISVT